MSDLLINGNDAETTYGVRMGNGFLNALLAPCQAKEYITNEVRNEHGTRYVVPSGAPYLAERSVTLSFVLKGDSEQDFYTKQQAFLAVMYAGAVNICVPAWSNSVIFRFYYTGNGCTWNMNTKRTIATITLKFNEPDPTNRGTSSNRSVNNTKGGISDDEEKTEVIDEGDEEKTEEDDTIGGEEVTDQR